MFRLLLVLLLCGALWFGYRELSAAVEPGGGAASEESVDLDETGLREPAPPAAVQPAPPLHAPAQPAGAPTADAELDDLIGGVASGDAAASARALELLATQNGGASAAVSQAVEAAGKRAGASASVSLLGENNTFLHSDAGRELARRSVDKASRLPPEQSVAALSKVVELCMRGPITKSDAEARAVVEEAAAALRRALLKTVLNPAHMARSRSYKVAPGDALERIAKHFRKLGYKVDAGTIMAFNRIDDPRRLRAGQVLKIPVEPIKTVVEKQSYLAAVYVGDLIFRLYWVGHGADDRTPEATFTIGAKIEHPDWYAPDGKVWPYGHPENVLGDYFIKFRHPSFTGFGAHGTSEPETVGTMASAGCLRLADEDIADYFKVVPRGTVVEIRATR